MRHERWLLSAILLSGLGAGLMQMAPLRPASHPALRPSRSIEANLAVSSVAKKILQRACQDCHSYQTRWPWYTRVAPVSWMVTEDVERARRAMNLSEWSAKPGVARGTLLAACESVETGRMPPASYRLMHPEARISPEQASTFCDWTKLEARGLRSRLMRDEREE